MKKRSRIFLKIKDLKIIGKKEKKNKIEFMAKTIVLNNYKKYWVRDTAQGHLIKICHGKNDDVLEIDCRWKDRERTDENRVINKK
jgi:hypothetical protein